jgi:hypothetical protein
MSKTSSRLSLGQNLLIFLILGHAASLQAALIAEWQFDSYSGGGTITSYNPEYGTQSGSATLNAIQPATKHAFTTVTGTDVNENATSSPNRALQMATTQGSPGSAVLTLQVSGTGLTGFVVKYASKDNSLTGHTQTWSYSTDGSTFNFFTTVNAPNDGSWALQTIDFSSITGLNNQSSVYFRNTIGFDNNNQSVSFDNISITAVPEPINAAFAGFGLILVGLSVGRFYLRRRRALIAA